MNTEKFYKCQGECREYKPVQAFYLPRSRSGRPSPYCIACNPNASLLAKYKAQIRRIGHKEFGGKIMQKENQVRLMLKAASEVN